MVEAKKGISWHDVYFQIKKKSLMERVAGEQWQQLFYLAVRFEQNLLGHKLAQEKNALKWEARFLARALAGADRPSYFKELFRDLRPDADPDILARVTRGMISAEKKIPLEETRKNFEQLLAMMSS